MTQKLSNWASIAEIISAFAIVVSLIFVGLEIRGNTAANYMSTYDRLLADTADWGMTLATNPETLDALEAFLASDDPNSLDARTWRRGEKAALSLMFVYERAYFARFYGRLGDAEWRRFQRLMCNPDNPGLRALKAGVTYTNFSDEFAEYYMRCANE